MATLSAYFDESGSPSSHAVIVSGFASTVEKWVRFDRDWKRAHADFGLPDPHEHPFHMKDFAHSNGVFEEWKGDEIRRRNFIDRLVSIIQIRAEFGFTFGVEMETYKQVNAIFPLRDRSVAPYALCALGCIFRANSWAKQQGHQIRHVLADGAIDKGRLLEMADPPYPRFGTMKEFLPCQAADFSAWEAHKFRGEFNAYSAGRKTPSASVAALYAKVPGQYLIADRDQLIDLCESWGLPRRVNGELPSK